MGRSPSEGCAPLARMAGGRDAMGVSALLVLLTACCALPTPSVEDQVVGLGEESQSPKDDSWFVDALESTQDDQSTTGQHAARLGEVELPSPSAEAVDPEKGVPAVIKKGSAPGGSPPVQPQQNPRFPYEPRNPYGQLLEDMEKQKRSQAAMTHKLRQYQKMQSMAASDIEQDATNNDIVAINALALAKKPSKKLDDAASAANVQLTEAEKNRREAEGLAAVHFATKGFKPVPDDHDARNPGAFSQMYMDNLKMKRLELDAKGLKNAFRSNPTPNSVKRDLDKSSKTRKKLQAQDSRYEGHERSTNPNPRRSKAYEKAQEDLDTKKNLQEMLHEAAEQFKSVRLTEPDMKYQDFVAGTAIEGIDNFEALDKEEQGKFAIEFAASAEKMAPKELQFEKDTENYRQHYDKDASTLPYQEWRKTFTMDRQANKILRPNEETAIQAAEDKMMKEYEHPDIAADIKAWSRRTRITMLSRTC